MESWASELIHYFKRNNKMTNTRNAGHHKRLKRPNVQIALKTSSNIPALCVPGRLRDLTYVWLKPDKTFKTIIKLSNHR